MCTLLCWLTSRINNLTAQHWALCVHHLMINSYIVSRASSPKSVLMLQWTFIYVPMNICTGILLALSLLNISRWLFKQLPRLSFSNTCMHTHKRTTSTHIHMSTHTWEHIHTLTDTHIVKAQVSYTLIFYPFHIFTDNLLFGRIVLVVRKCQIGKII